MTDRPVLLWLRQDLRLADHPALAAAAATGRPIVPVYVFDDETPKPWAPGGASRWWLGTGLPRLAAALERAGSRLVVRRGNFLDIIAGLAAETGASGVYFSRSFEPWATRLEHDLEERLEHAGVEVRGFAGTLLVEPEAVANQAGEPFRVYSPFARAVEALPGIRSPAPAPKHLKAPGRWPDGMPSEALGLLPTTPDWAGGMREAWEPGEDGAHKRLAAFLVGPIDKYEALRDQPGVDGTSRLSPHLHFGEISPATCWHATAALAAAGGAAGAGARKFRRELLWREFSHHLLFHFPHLPERPFRPEFTRFPWKPDAAALKAWQRGTTGYPIVDAGMRELWHTGYMHNRVRMIVASFLVKDLLVPWRDGADWFWDTLVDADLGNNAASWQWVAGSGADAAPYFRIFNPVKQGEKFDPEGRYVRAWVPELAKLPAAHIHAPFAAPEAVLASAGVALGTTYPRPIVDHKLARKMALDAFASIKAG